jgi:prepilin-type N-terminal cleavage/methylation domain-containing protein
MKKDEKGFTLVEILIVIMIIGMLSVMAIGGYTSYRRVALVNLNADNLVAQILEARGKASRGDFKSARAGEIRDGLTNGVTTFAPSETPDAQCFGFELNQIDGEFVAKNLSWDFDNVKEWMQGRWQEKGCDGEASDGVFQVEVDDMIHIEEVKYTTSSSEFDVSSSATLKFAPPNGDLEFLADGNNHNEAETLNILVKYGTSEEPRYKRKIIVDLKSLTITVKNVE